jgi:hypothetical protein
MFDSDQAQINSGEGVMDSVSGRENWVVEGGNLNSGGRGLKVE